jgi:hypothetical protein
MAHTFTIRVTGEIALALKRVESKITGDGGAFQGNAEKGSFAGKSILGVIKGEYCSVAESEISVTIKEKPFLIPYSMIESEIKKFIG